MSMTHDQIERCDALWRELLAAGRVRWMSGMLARADGWEPLRLAVEFLPRVWSGIAGDVVGHEHAHNVGDDAAPVWTDPATIGCLVAMAREAWSPIDISVARQLVGSRGPWWVSCDDHDKPPTLASAETEPEALLLAIQAATA